MMNDFEVWPGPMEGVGKGGFIEAVNLLHLTGRWMTPFFRVSQELPRRKSFVRFAELFFSGGVPVCVQLMGTDAGLLGAAGEEFLRMGAESLNLNFGCPSSKVISGGAGGGALKAPEKLAEFCCRVKAALPDGAKLSVKLRTGWASPEDMRIFLPQIAGCGAVDKVFLHYRTVKEGYSPEALVFREARLKEAVELSSPLPLIANGDITGVEMAKHLVERTGCAGVMIARPWLQDPYLLRRFSDPAVPEAEAGRELFFSELQKKNLHIGAQIELARMIWGVRDRRFLELIARQPV